MAPQEIASEEIRPDVDIRSLLNLDADEGGPLFFLYALDKGFLLGTYQRQAQVFPLLRKLRVSSFHLLQAF